MTNYPEPLNNPHQNMSDDVREIMQIRQLFERPVELLGVSAYEISTMYMPRLHAAIGDTAGYQQLVQQAKMATDRMQESARIIGEMRMRLEAIANAVKRAGG